MRVERFIDTNILLYGYDLDAPAKREVALTWIERALTEPTRNAVSVQVLQEFHVNFVRKGGAEEEATLLVEDFARLVVIENSLALLRLGMKAQQRWQLSLWDALIVAAAQTCGASELVTEDLNDGQDYDGVRAVNPFAGL